MSLTTSIEQPQRRNGVARPYPRTLPQWSLDACRPVIRVLSRLLWSARWRNLHYIPPNGGLIIAANHQTYIDPFWLSIPIKRPLRYLAWDEAFDWPLVGKLLGLFGAWPLQIERSDPAAIRRTIQWLKNGGAVVIFPEGARSPATGKLDRFKGGAVRLAIEAEVPILPVTIRGGNRVWPRGRYLPRPAEVEITYHPLFHVTQKPDEEARKCARRESERLSAVIGSAL